MKYIFPLIALLLIFRFQNASAQYYNTGQDPSSIRWLRLKTDKFDVIYPESYGEAGINFARTLDESYSRLSALFPPKKIRIPVVIHSHSTRSNGYVAWAPRRMEIYPATDQNAIPGDQHLLLTLHEATHVAEMESLKTGFSKAASFLFGEQFTGVTAALLPLWYLEGNAVVSETVLTGSGRGRNASFMEQIKAVAVQEGNYKYDKMLLGSYNDFVPDHYQYGYQMTGWAMSRYDPGIWNKVLAFTGEQPFTINPVNISMRRNTGLTKRKLYREAFDSLKVTWKEEAAQTEGADEALNPPKRDDFISYHSPVMIGKDSIAAVKTSLSTTAQIVLLSGGREKLLHYPGGMYPRFISYGGGKIVWVEQRPDIRWTNRDFQVIRSMDLETGVVSSVTGKSRYLSASVSPDGDRIAAIGQTTGSRNELFLLDAADGTVLRTIPSLHNYEIQRPQWSADGSLVTVIYLTDDGEGIMACSPEDGSWKILIEATNADIQSSFFRNDSLFYASSATGTDNIYMKAPDGKTTRLTDVPFGAGDLYVQHDKILFTSYTANGNDICMAGIDSSYTGKDSQSSYIINSIKTPFRATSPDTDLNYSPKPYRKWQHLFRFHSWMPFYADLDRIQSDPLSIRPGVTLMSQNTLSTLVTTLGYEYSADKRHLFHTTVNWLGWYPVIRNKLDYGYYPSVFGSGSFTMQPGLKYTNELSLPFFFSSGRFSHYFRLAINTEYSNNVYPANDNRFDFGQTNITGRLYFSNYTGTAQRDIYPQWGQTIDINHVAAPFDKEIFGSSTFLRSSFFLPGLFRDNGLRLRLESEIQKQSKFIFANRISFPRGYSGMAYPAGYYNIISDRLNFFSGDYVFPVVYPDLSLTSLFYLKRIRGGLFYDHAWGKGNRYYIRTAQGRMIQTEYHDYTESFRSYGAQLLADFHIFRIPFEISGGVQAAWRPGRETPVINAVFNMDLYGFSLGR